MKFWIHRGAKEIGGNCIELSSEGKTLLLDLGMPLTLGGPVNASLPDVAGLADGNNESFLGVAHETLMSLATWKQWIKEEEGRFADVAHTPPKKYPCDA
jgi:hypothetical protein